MIEYNDLEKYHEVIISIGGTDFGFKLDTGAFITCISQANLNKLLMYGAYVRSTEYKCKCRGYSSTSSITGDIKIMQGVSIEGISIGRILIFVNPNTSNTLLADDIFSCMSGTFTPEGICVTRFDNDKYLKNMRDHLKYCTDLDNNSIDRIVEDLFKDDTVVTSRNSALDRLLKM